MYRELLTQLPRLCDRLDDYRSLWQNGDEALTETERLIDSRQITIDEDPELDFAVVRGPERAAAYHPFAIHTRTRSTRLLIFRGRRAEFVYRYEGWVQLASRRPAARVDLANLARELTNEERSGGRWVSDGVDEITPSLRLEGAAETSIDHNRIRDRVAEALRSGEPAWNPYNGA